MKFLEIIISITMVIICSYCIALYIEQSNLKVQTMKCRVFKTTEKYSPHEQCHNIIEMENLNIFFKLQQENETGFDCKFLVTSGDNCCCSWKNDYTTEAVLTIEILDDETL